MSDPPPESDRLELKSPSGQSARAVFGSRVFLGSDDRLRPIFRALLFLLLGLLLMTAVQQTVFKLGHEWAKAAQFAVIYFTTNILFLLASWFFLWAFDQRSFRALGLWFYRGWGRELALGMGVGASLLTCVVAMLVVTQRVAYHGWADVSGKNLLQLASTGGLLLLAAGFEEILFRGYGFQRLVDALGNVPAVAIFSALFAAAHLQNPSPTALSAANTMLAGTLLSVAYLKTRALWLPIGLHWAWNFAMGPIFSLPVSGIRIESVLFRVEIDGPPWMTGGTYGPEGGAAATLVCIVAIIWLARTRRLTPSPAMKEVLH